MQGAAAIADAPRALRIPAGPRRSRTSLEPCTPAELLTLVHAGETDSDAVESLLAKVARAQGALDLAIGDGLAALTVGDRLIALGFASLRDYAREVLGVRERTAQSMARLSRELRARPLLRAAVMSGEVRIRHAQTVLPVAVGGDEPFWVERARHETVRALEAAVRASRSVEDDETWMRFRVRLAPNAREIVDEALDIAGRVLPGSSRARRLEAMAQVRRSGIWRIAGFASFEHYCAERLGLCARAVEQRAALERRIWQVPALRVARDAGLSYEKVRLLSRLPDAEIEAWVPRAQGLTCVDLREALDARDDGQMRAARIFRAGVPERTALLLQSAFRAVRAVEGRLLDEGTCLVQLALHFIATWKAHGKRPRTVSQRARERDLVRCRVPGCSARAVHAHHVVPRSRGGADDPSNLVALCACHHLRGVHGGYLRVRGTAPDGLVWELTGSGARSLRFFGSRRLVALHTEVVIP